MTYHLRKEHNMAYLEGMKAAFKNDLKNLSSILKKLKDDRYKSSLNVGNESYALCSAGEYSSIAPSQLDIDIVSIVEMELDALSSKMKGDHDTSLSKLKEASELDATLKYAFGPPIILKPVHEMYAEYLAEQNKKVEAIEIYSQSLNRHPKTKTFL